MSAMTDNNKILETYKRTNSIWKTGKICKLSGQRVHEILLEANVECLGRGRFFTEEDKKILIGEYGLYSSEGNLDVLAKKMGRTKQFICRQARYLGLTNRHRKKKWAHSDVRRWDSTMATIFLNDFQKQTLNFDQYCLSLGINELIVSQVLASVVPARWDEIKEERMIMGNSLYKKGRAFEYKIKSIFETCGFFVIRAAQSKGVADLVALKSGHYPVMIQCKVGRWYDVEEWNEFLLAANRAGAIPIYANRFNGETRIMKITGRKEGKKPISAITEEFTFT